MWSIMSTTFIMTYDVHAMKCQGCFNKTVTQTQSKVMVLKRHHKTERISLSAIQVLRQKKN